MSRSISESQKNAIDYIGYVIRNWTPWQTHHRRLTDSMREVLSLIKELTEENERLKGRNEHLAECLDIEDKYKYRLQGILLQFTDIVNKWGNKNGYDTSEISLVPVIYEANTIKSQIVADTVRKMQERLKAEMSFGRYIQADQIDQIAKEMLEG